MNLYSYQYLINNFSAVNYFYIGLIVFVAAIMVITGYFYYRNQNDFRFRNLFILVSLVGALVIVLQVSRFNNQRSSDSQTGQTVQVLKTLAKQKHVPINQVYSSSNVLSDGMTIKLGKHFYLVHMNNDKTNYSIQETKLVNKPKYVDKGEFKFWGNNSSNGIDYGSVALKFIVGLIMIVLQINLSGKGNLAPSNALDQLQNYILGGIIGGVIYNSQITVLQFVAILLIWSIIVFAIKYLTSQSNILDTIINGSPQVLIDNGKVNVKRALKNGINANELSFKLRSNGVNDFSNVKNATLEQNGQLTITTFDDDESQNYPLITDGQVDLPAMKRFNLAPEDIDQLLNEQHVTLKQVYLGQYQDHKLNLVLYPTNRRIL
ncbi:DUF3290 family protein [Fructilactobacillus cliffordii]|uniref:DUF3290 family protein n=1 Tax=Fructilactobacillus cliffordii TaxID=2940299 RepID=UPI002093B0B1|nr:DUF3290 family protein [Fructilactobacillus cliffordii]USS86162.1 DUF3290 family protein [Fructilactobacillus cliffordii]